MHCVYCSVEYGAIAPDNAGTYARTHARARTRTHTKRLSMGIYEI